MRRIESAAVPPLDTSGPPGTEYRYVIDMKETMRGRGLILLVVHTLQVRRRGEVYGRQFIDDRNPTA